MEQLNATSGNIWQQIQNYHYVILLFKQVCAMVAKTNYIHDRYPKLECTQMRFLIPLLGFTKLDHQINHDIRNT